MPQSINCVCAGEASSKLECLLSVRKNTELFGNIWIWSSEWRVCICRGNICRKKLLPDVRGKKKTTKNLLFKHELSICCHSALWAFRKHQMAAGSELLAAVCGLRPMPAGVCAFAPGKCGSWLGRVSHFLLHKPNFKIPCVEYFFQMWPCKSSFVALQTAQALFWWLCSMYVAISLYLGFISLEGTWSKAAGKGAGASPASWVHRQNILIVLCVLLCLW